MSVATGKRSSGAPRGWAGVRRRLGAFVLVALLLPSAGAAAVALASAHAPTAVAVHALSSPGPTALAVHPSSEPTCYDLNNTTCVQATPGSPDIIPSPGNHSSAVLPSSTSSIVITIRSMWDIVPPGVVNATGNRAPIALNVTGVLWNGDPWYSQYDSSIWHSRSQTDPYWQASPATVNNTWPYAYQVTFWNHTTQNQPIFYAGMTISWWIYIVTRSVGNIYIGHVMKPTFTFTYAGSWPSSPYPNAAQYGGAQAALADVSVHQVPLQPNWNDTVHVGLAVTGLDSITGATIGSATLYVQERRANGAIFQNGSFAFPVTVVSGVGAVKTEVSIPHGFSAIVGLNVTYWVVAYDTAQNEIDMITTPTFSYTVHGNGSFQSGQFGNDILLTTTPTDVELHGPPTPVVAAGENVSVTIQSRSASASILTAVLEYTFTYNATGAVAHGQASFSRNNSTTMYTTLPGFPISATVNFTVLAWDYTQLLDISPQYSFITPEFNRFVPANLTFFTVLVFDNGSSSWVTGASVQIRDPSGFVNSQSLTYFGVAYPNETLSRWTPLLVPANVTYNISVLDRSFLPAGSTAPTAVSIEVKAVNPMVFIGTLAQSDHYAIIQEGSSIFFYLNTTPIGPQFSPANPSSVPLTAILGGLAALGAMAVVLPWWVRIQERRKAEEKRVTL